MRVDIKDLVEAAANDLAIARDSAEGRLYYSAYMSYVPVVEKISARGKNERGEEQDPWYWHAYWDYWTQTEVRDDRVAAFATFLSRGTYEYVYLARATVPGEFQVLPARACQMYSPDVFGRTAGATFRVTGE